MKFLKIIKYAIICFFCFASFACQISQPTKQSNNTDCSADSSSSGCVVEVPESFTVQIDSFTSNSVTLKWNESKNATKYNIKYGTSSQSYTISNLINVTSPYKIENLSTGTNYYFVVEAKNSGTASTISNEIFVIPGAGLSFLNSTYHWYSDPASTAKISASGGAGNVSYTIDNALGIIDTLTSVFTPSFSKNKQTMTVRATDQMGQTATAQIIQLPSWIWTNGTVLTSAIDSNNHLYIGGSFTQVGHIFPAPKFIAMDLTTGNPQITCDYLSGFNSTVYKIEITTDAIFAGGLFTSYQGQSANYLAKLNKKCELDTTFTLSSGFDSTVTAIAVDKTTNSLYVGGSFYSYRGVSNSSLRLAKLDMTTGNLDTTFTQSNSGFDAGLNAIVIDKATNSLYAGGAFSSYRGVSNSALRLAKLDMTTGNLDTTFTQNNSGMNSQVYALALNPETNSLYAGGAFSSYRGVSNSALRLAKLDMTTGNLDTTFTQNNSGMNSTVYALAISKDNNSLYIGGFFSSYRGVSNSALRLAKLDMTTGNLDTTFTQQSSGATGIVNSLAIDKNSLYVGGALTAYRSGTSNIKNILKLDLVSGNLDTTFTQSNSGLNSTVSALAVDITSNILYAGGSFTNYRGVPNTAQYLAKLDLASGLLDTTFTQNNSGFNAVVNTLAINQSSNSIYVAGNFTGYRGGTNNSMYLAKLDMTTGNLDTTFTQSNSGFDNNIFSLVVSSINSSLYVGGSFTGYRGTSNSALRLAKLDLTSGNLDTTFTQSNSGFDNVVYSIAINTSNSSVYVGGSFTGYRGASNSALRLAKLNMTSGNLDTTFTQSNSGLDGTVNSLAINSSSNSIYVGGSFFSYRGGLYLSSQCLAKLDLTTGNLDTAFTRQGGGFDNTVYALAINSSNNSLYVGGSFLSYDNWQDTSFRLAKVDLTTGSLDSAFTQFRSGFDNTVRTISLSSTDSSVLYVGGSFSSYRNANGINSIVLNSSTGDQ